MSRPHLWVKIHDAARESTMFIQIESFMSFEVFHIWVSIHSNSIGSSTVGYGYLKYADCREKGDLEEIPIHSSNIVNP